MDKDISLSLPPLRDIIRDFDLRAEKKLGQNFILDQNVTDKIVRAAGQISAEHVFEIGPGPGGLTRSILRAAPSRLTAIEFDPRAVKALQGLQAAYGDLFTVIHGDALRADIAALSPDTSRAIIANLPYNIATVLLLGWLRQIRSDSRFVQGMTLMFQKEVAQRIVAAPHSKAYGRLSVMCQWLCDVHICFDLPPSAFVPPPKVTSTIVHFRPRLPQADWPDFKLMERVTATAFNQRRKMIRSSLKDFLPALHAAGLNETLRAEDLSVENYLTVCRNIG